MNGSIVSTFETVDNSFIPSSLEYPSRNGAISHRKVLIRVQCMEAMIQG